MPNKLTKEEIASNLTNGWSFDQKQNAITKEFKKVDFSDSVAFIGKIAVIANAQDHHPDIWLHGYNKVRVILSTHDAGGITPNDFKLAKSIDTI